MKRIISYYIGLTMRQIIKYILWLIVSSGSAAYMAQLLVENVINLNQYKITIIIVFAAVGALIFVTIYEKINRNRPHFESLDPDFLIKEKVITYEYITKNKMLYKKRVLLKALKNNLTAYNDKYFWTGTGKIRIKSAIKEHVYKRTIIKNQWQHYQICFFRTLKKNDKIETELIWELEDMGNTARPFVSSTIEEPTDLLVLKVQLPTDFQVKEATCEISSGAGTRKPFISFSKEFNRDNTIEWKIKAPKLLHHYEMRWVNY